MGQIFALLNRRGRLSLGRFVLAERGVRAGRFLLERFEVGYGFGRSETAVGRLHPGADGLHQQLNRLAGVWWNIDRRRENSAAHPFLAGFRKSVAAEERNFLP